jgi:hypothetical protein
MVPAAKKKDQATDDKKNLYRPLYKLMGKVIKQIKKIELDVPIYKIAWMEVRGNFLAKRHNKFRADVINFLRVSNEYRKIYWNLIKLSRRKFDVEMKKDGSCAPGVKEYESLKNEIPHAIIKTGKKVWIHSYDDYLPKIRQRSEKIKKKPRDGKRMHYAIQQDLKDVLNTLKAQQKEALEFARQFRNQLELVKNEPKRRWEPLSRINSTKGQADIEINKNDDKTNKKDKSMKKR